mgnify:CR=1 FL=1
MSLQHVPSSEMIDTAPVMQRVGDRYGEYEIGPMDPLNPTKKLVFYHRSLAGTPEHGTQYTSSIVAKN